MVTVARWECAQEYERGYWARLAGRIAGGSVSQLDWYRWRAEQLERRLALAGLSAMSAGNARLVEVGCGPIGVASFFPARERVAVDPLEEFYSADPVLSALRNPAVSYRRGKGESLPCDDSSFDLAIIENCIDHVQDVDAVMREIRRVLRPDGVIFLTVNCRTPWGFGVHRLLSRLRIDPGHPHTFTPSRARGMLRRHGFEILRVEADSYLAALREDLASREAKARIKAVLGTSEFVVSILARAGNGAPRPPRGRAADEATPALSAR
jgi:SAM-dependent methyltransferase